MKKIGKMRGQNNFLYFFHQLCIQFRFYEIDLIDKQIRNEFKTNTQFKAYNYFTKNQKKSESHSHAIQINFYHPISTQMFMKINRFCNLDSNLNQILIDFDDNFNNQLFYENDKYIFPFVHFRIEYQLYDLKQTAKTVNGQFMYNQKNFVDENIEIQYVQDGQEVFCIGIQQVLNIDNYLKTRDLNLGKKFTELGISTKNQNFYYLNYLIIKINPAKTETINSEELDKILNQKLPQLSSKKKKLNQKQVSFENIPKKKLEFNQATIQKQKSEQDQEKVVIDNNNSNISNNNNNNNNNKQQKEDSTNNNNSYINEEEKQKDSEDNISYSADSETARYSEIKNKVSQLAKSHDGSRILQKFFQKCQQSELDLVLNEIEKDMSKLMQDTYANYMFQTLTQRCSQEQRKKILLQIESNIIETVCDKRGTHSLQSLVSLSNSAEEEKLIIKMIEKKTYQLIVDPQGTHFIQKIVSKFSFQNIQGILDVSIRDFLKVVNNASGVCVLKSLISKYKQVEKTINLIIKKLVQNLEVIIVDPYGNYAIQHIIEIFDFDEISQVIDYIYENVCDLSINKYASNVVEKCLIYSPDNFLESCLSQIGRKDTMITLCNNKFGNYVLKKAFQLANKDQYEYMNKNLLKIDCSKTIKNYILHQK